MATPHLSDRPADKIIPAASHEEPTGYESENAGSDASQLLVSMHRNYLPLANPDSDLAPTLTFSYPKPGKSSFLVISIMQLRASTPVTITTDVPGVFEIASDASPHFSAHLVQTTADTGTYIHLRYTPSGWQGARGWLTLETPYETRRIALTGQSVIKLPVVSVRSTPGYPVAPLLLPSPDKKAPFRWGWLAAALVLSMMVYAGYAFRNQPWLKSLFQRHPAAPATASQQPPLVPAPAGNPDNLRKNGSDATTETTRSSARPTKTEARKSRQVRRKKVAPAAVAPITPAPPVNKPAAPAESDLEKELNRVKNPLPVNP